MSKNERYLIRRVLDGIAGWLTYKQAAGAKTLYCEHFLYPPIHDLAKGREWTVRAQERIQRVAGTRGAPETIDFMFYRKKTNAHSPGLVLLEIKYVRNKNKSIEIAGLAEDIEKLRKTDPSKLESANMISECGDPEKFLLVLGQGKVFQALAHSKSEKHPKIVEMLESALQSKPPKAVYRSSVESKLKRNSIGTPSLLANAFGPSNRVRPLRPSFQRRLLLTQDRHPGNDRRRYHIVGT